MSLADGDGSVADALLGADAGAARTAAVRAAFTDALADRAPDLPARTLADDSARAAEPYGAALPHLGLPQHEGALEDLRALPRVLAAAEGDVLTPADAYPDNNVVGADRVRLIDFEPAELRHRAWDVAYLLAPWPSCWCAWSLPPEVAEAGIAASCASAGEDVRPEQLAQDLGGRGARMAEQAGQPTAFTYLRHGDTKVSPPADTS